MRRVLTIFRLPLVALLLIATTASCDFESDEFFLDETFGRVYNVGDLYVDKYGNRGIICNKVVSRRGELTCLVAISLYESEEPWGVVGQTVMHKDTLIVESTEHPFGLGVLQRMVELGIEKFPAQRWCNEKNYGDSPYMGSWHLPSPKELSSIESHLDDLNYQILHKGGTPIAENQLYWTCVEDFPGIYEDENLVGELQYDSENRALPVYPVNTMLYKSREEWILKNKDRWIKKTPYRVRAIKYIYYKG